MITTKNATKILLEKGSQHFQSKEKKLSVLYFDEYLLDINQNENKSFLDRWKSPAERTLYELKNPDPESRDDLLNLQAFKAEITLRYAMPLNVIGFSLLVLFIVLSFNFHRNENILRTVFVFATIISLQVISIVSSNFSIKGSEMENLNFFPLFFCFLSLIFFIIRVKKI